MIALAHFFAISCYIGSVAVAATPLARPVKAPVGLLCFVLAAGVAAHLIGLGSYWLHFSAVPLTGLGPALSFAAVLIAATLLVVELTAQEVSLTLIAAPLAAIVAIIAVSLGLHPAASVSGVQGVWLSSHIALSFAGMATFATAAAAGAMYLVERRELKSRRFGAVFRVFPPLETLDRVNHLASITSWLALTVGIVLAATYSIEYQQLNVLQMTWGTVAWLAVSFIALGRILSGWQARRAALYSSLAFAAVVVLYVAFRITGSGAGRFL
jgi:ABC-type transport system involved in cytochrome c biogenesis permease subunit